MGSNSIKRLDLTKSGEATLYTVSDKKVKSARINSMNGMEVNFFTQTEEPEKNDGLWEVEIEVNIYVYKIQFSTYIFPPHHSNRSNC